MNVGLDLLGVFLHGCCEFGCQHRSGMHVLNETLSLPTVLEDSFADAERSAYRLLLRFDFCCEMSRLSIAF